MRDHTEDTYTITLSDLDESGMTVTSSLTMAEPTIDVSSITTSTIDTSAFDELFSSETDILLDINTPVEFEDHMPEVSKIEDMCNDYPALAKAYENFRSIYAMVHQDWKGKQDAENIPPF
jgi:hypothetical protein